MSTTPSDHPDLAGAPDETPEAGDAAPGQTGHPDVDAALERVRDVDDLPVADHVAVYDDVQQRLAAAMDDTDDRRSTPGAG